MTKQEELVIQRGKTYFYCPYCKKVTDGSKHADNAGYIH